MPESMSCFTQHMLSGAVAGTTEHLAMYPVDTIKTRMQASTSRIEFVGLLEAIATREGLRGFSRGATAVALSAGPAHAVYFATYERVKNMIVTARRGGAQAGPAAGGAGPWVSELLGYSLAGAAATMAADAVATPLDVVKQRMQLPTTAYRNVFDCTAQILKKEGVAAFFRSYRTTVVMNVPYTLIHFPVYEFTKRFLEPGKRGEDSLLQAMEGESEGGEGTWTHMLAGGAAGGAAAAVTTPLDVVKTRMQIGLGAASGRCVAAARAGGRYPPGGGAMIPTAGRAPRAAGGAADRARPLRRPCARVFLIYRSSAILPVIQDVVRKEGVGALWRGMLPRVLFHAPSTAICWASYEACKSFFGTKPAKAIGRESESLPS